MFSNIEATSINLNKQSSRSIMNNCHQGQKMRSRLFQNSISDLFKSPNDDLIEELNDNDESQQENSIQEEMQLDIDEIESKSVNLSEQSGVQKKNSIPSENSPRRQQALTMQLEILDQQSKQLHQLVDKKDQKKIMPQSNTLLNISRSVLFKKNAQYSNQFNYQVWKKSSFIIICMVNKFKFNLKRRTLLFKPQNLTKFQFAMINDKASKGPGDNWEQKALNISFSNKKEYCFGNSQLLKQMVRKLKQIQRTIGQAQFFKIGKNLLGKINEKIPIFHSHNVFRIIWDFIIFILKILLILDIPFQICFNGENLFEPIVSNLLAPLLFALDGAINANTSFYDSGILIQQRFLILMNFVREKMVPTIFIIIFLINGYDDSYLISILLYLLLLLETFRHSQSLDYVRNQMEISIKMSSFRDLFQLFGKILYFNHIFACIIHWVAQIEISNKNQNNWLQRNHLHSQSVFSRYVASFYYGTITMCTVGYGDLHPESDYERITIIVLAFLSSGIFGYTLNSIGSIIMELGRRDQKYKHEMAQLNNFMKDHNVDAALQNQARNYAQFIHNEDLDISKDHSKSCLKVLSKGMQQHILKNIFYSKLHKIPFLRKNFSQSFLEMLAIKIKERMLGPGDILMKNGEQITPSIFIVEKGKLEIIARKKNPLNGENEEESSTIFQNMTKGDVFGQIEFFSNSQEATYTVLSIGITNLLVLNLEDFMSALEEQNNPVDKENFYYMKDTVMFSQKFDVIDLMCFSCHTIDHISLNCPFLVYGGDKYKMIKHINREESDFRKSFVRTKRPKNNALVRINDKQIIALNWYSHNKIYRDKYEEVFFLNEEMFEDYGLTDSVLVDFQKGNQLNYFDAEIQLSQAQSEKLIAKDFIQEESSSSLIDADVPKIIPRDRPRFNHRVQSTQFLIENDLRKLAFMNMSSLEARQGQLEQNKLENDRSPISMLNSISKKATNQDNQPDKIIQDENSYEVNVSSQNSLKEQSPQNFTDAIKFEQTQNNFQIDFLNYIGNSILEIQKDMRMLHQNTTQNQYKLRRSTHHQHTLVEAEYPILNSVTTDRENQSESPTQNIQQRNEQKYAAYPHENDDIDQIKSFEIYFPKFNIENIEYKSNKKRLEIPQSFDDDQNRVLGEIMKKQIQNMASRQFSQIDEKSQNQSNLQSQSPILVAEKNINL